MRYFLLGVSQLWYLIKCVWFLSADNEPNSIIFHNFSPRGRQEYRPGNITLLASSIMTNNSADLLCNFHLEAKEAHVMKFCFYLYCTLAYILLTTKNSTILITMCIFPSKLRSLEMLMSHFVKKLIFYSPQYI